jgi:hypothetical protein
MDEHVEAIHLKYAILCVNCECVSKSTQRGCAVCGSTSVLSLSRLLNREKSEIDQPSPRRGLRIMRGKVQKVG